MAPAPAASRGRVVARRCRLGVEGGALVLTTQAGRREVLAAESVVDGYLQRRRVRCTPPERMVVVQAWAAMAEDVRARRQDDERWMAAAYGFVPMGSEHAGDLVAMTVAHLSGVQDATGGAATGQPDRFASGCAPPAAGPLGRPAT